MGYDVAHLTGVEIMAFIDAMEEMDAHGVSPIISHITETDYWRLPPTIMEFCEDDYWLGSVLRTDENLQQKGLYPKWRACLYEALGPGSQVEQILITGAIGLGKTMVGAIIVLYRLARLLCMRDPMGYYDLLRVSRLVVSVFSVTREQVMTGAFQDIINLMAISPFFTEMMPVGDRKFSNYRVEFPRNIVLKAGSRIQQALGGNVLVSFVDEINYRLEKDAARGAKNLVDGIQQRQESRFKQVTDRLLILISSAKSQVDFLTSHIERNRRNPKVRIWDFPIWDVKGGVTIHYNGIRFPVDMGDNIHPPQVLPYPDLRDPSAPPDLGAVQYKTPKNDEEKAAIKALAMIPAHRLLWVPEEYREPFESDPTMAIMNIAGRVTGRMSKFFPDANVLIQSIMDLTPPFESETLKLSVNSTHQLYDLLADQGRRLVQSRGSAFVPLRHPSMVRYIHLDVATGGVDALGLVMVHPVCTTQVKRVELATQQFQDSLQAIYEVDFAVEVIREFPGQEIDFGKLRVFIAWLRNMGFNIRCISCDLRTLSMEMRNILRQMGFNSAYLSVDKTRVPYDTLKQVALERRLRIQPGSLLGLELVNLEDLITKIDHPEKFDTPWGKATYRTRGSKNVSDALAGAVYMAETDEDRPNLPQFSTEQLQIATRGPAQHRPFESIPPPRDIVPTF